MGRRSCLGSSQRFACVGATGLLIGGLLLFATLTANDQIHNTNHDDSVPPPSSGVTLGELQQEEESLPKLEAKELNEELTSLQDMEAAIKSQARRKRAARWPTTVHMESPKRLRKTQRKRAAQKLKKTRTKADPHQGKQEKKSLVDDIVFSKTLTTPKDSNARLALAEAILNGPGQEILLDEESPVEPLPNEEKRPTKKTHHTIRRVKKKTTKKAELHQATKLRNTASRSKRGESLLEAHEAQSESASVSRISLRSENARVAKHLARAESALNPTRSTEMSLDEIATPKPQASAKQAESDKMKAKQRDLIKKEMAKPVKVEHSRRHVHQAAMSAADSAARAAKKAVGELRSLRNSAEHGVAEAKAAVAAHLARAEHTLQETATRRDEPVMSLDEISVASAAPKRQASLKQAESAVAAHLARAEHALQGNAREMSLDEIATPEPQASLKQTESAVAARTRVVAVQRIINRDLARAERSLHGNAKEHVVVPMIEPPMSLDEISVASAAPKPQASLKQAELAVAAHLARAEHALQGNAKETATHRDEPVMSLDEISVASAAPKPQASLKQAELAHGVSGLRHTVAVAAHVARAETIKRMRPIVEESENALALKRQLAASQAFSQEYMPEEKAEEAAVPLW